VKYNVRLLPKKEVDNNLMYLTVRGVRQGLISAGASTPESIGKNYKRGHEDQILVKCCNYSISNPTHKGSGRTMGKSHSEPLAITKLLDKSSPLLHEAMKGELLPHVQLDFYRNSRFGRPELYYKVILKNAKVVVSDAFMILGSNEPLEHIYFTYGEIIFEHVQASTISQNYWQHSESFHVQKMYALGNELNGYNALMTSIEKRRIFFEKYPHYGCENLAIFWMVATAPLGVIAASRGMLQAGYWAYRNPILVTDVGLDIVGSWLPGTAPAWSSGGVIGAIGGTIYGYEKW